MVRVAVVLDAFGVVAVLEVFEVAAVLDIVAVLDVPDVVAVLEAFDVGALAVETFHRNFSINVEILIKFKLNIRYR